MATFFYFASQMPYKEKEIEKLYYSISEVATMFDVNTSLIRFWEKEFIVLKPTKNKKGNRLFTKEDIENLRTIYHLVKEKGYTLQGAKDQLKGSKKSEIVQNAEVISKLKEIKSYLIDLKQLVEDAPTQDSNGKEKKKRLPKVVVTSILDDEDEKEAKPAVVEVSPNQISLFDF